MVSRKALKTVLTGFKCCYGLETGSQDRFDRFRVPFWSREGFSRPFRPDSSVVLVSRRFLETFSAVFECCFGLETGSRDLFNRIQVLLWSRDGFSRPFQPFSSAVLVSRRVLETFSTGFKCCYGLEEGSRDRFDRLQVLFWCRGGISRHFRPDSSAVMVSRRVLGTVSTDSECCFGFEEGSRDFFDRIQVLLWSRARLSRPFRPDSCAVMVSSTALKTFSTGFMCCYGLEHGSQDLFDRIHVLLWSRARLSRPFRPDSCAVMVSRRVLKTVSTGFRCCYGLEEGSQDLFDRIQVLFWFRDRHSRPSFTSKKNQKLLLSMYISIMYHFYSFK